MANPVHLLNPAGDQQVEGHVTAKQNLRLYSDTAFLGTLDHAITAARTWTLPNTAGTLALTSDLVTDHGALTGLLDDDHTQYRLESADHSHQSTGLQAGQLDHGLALTGLGDDDHTQYGLKSGTLAQFAATTSALLRGVISDENGTGVALFDNATSPIFITQITSPMVVGGTGTTSTLTLKATSGVGAAGADIIFLVGNNGATEAARILNSGNFGIGMSPVEKLSVAGDVLARLSQDAPTIIGAHNTNTGTGARARLVLGDSTVTSMFAIFNYLPSTGGLTFFLNESTDSPSSGDLNFSTRGLTGTQNVRFRSELGNFLFGDNGAGKLGVRISANVNEAVTLANAEWLGAVNAAGSGSQKIISLNASNLIAYGAARAAASVAANFSADFYIRFQDVNGAEFYVPAKNAAW